MKNYRFLALGLICGFIASRAQKETSKRPSDFPLPVPFQADKLTGPATGMCWHQPVTRVFTENQPLSGCGSLLPEGTRVLVAGQKAREENAFYTVKKGDWHHCNDASNIRFSSAVLCEMQQGYWEQISDNSQPYHWVHRPL